MKLTRKQTVMYAVLWTGSSLNEIRAGLPGLDAMVGNDGVLHIIAGKKGAQGWVPVPVGHVIMTDGSGDDFWPVDWDYVVANFDFHDEDKP